MPNSDLKLKTPKTKEEYRLEEIDGEVLLYSLASTRSIYLNTSASIIWQLCDGEQNVTQIIDLIKAHYPEAKQDVEQDVLHTIEQFLDAQAITLA